MHRTYSMRQSRAPTASQIQNPPPPSSSTKSHRLFGKASIGESFALAQEAMKYRSISISLSTFRFHNSEKLKVRGRRIGRGLLSISFLCHDIQSNSGAQDYFLLLYIFPSSLIHGAKSSRCHRLTLFFLRWRRSCFPQIHCWCLWPRTRQEAVTAR